jgi:phage host-nuclease inhibitor protein Gam
MATATAGVKTPRITNTKQLNQALWDLGEKHADLEQARLQLAKASQPHVQKLRAVEEDHKPRISTLEAEIAALASVAAEYVDQNREEVLDDDLKVELLNGTIAIHKNPEKCEIEKGKENAIIAALRKLKLTKLIRTKTELDKNALKKEKGRVQDIEGIRFVQEEKCIIKPALLNEPITVPLAPAS